MRLTVLVNPQTRTATFREVSYLAAGDECGLLLHGVAGADTASLSLVLYRDATLAYPVAAVPAGSFSDVPNHRDDRTASLSLASREMEAWFASAVLSQESESSESGLSGASAEAAVRALGWLVVADSSRVWVAMRVPVLLRSFAVSGDPVDGSTVAASVMAAVRAALAGKVDAVPGKGLSSNDFTDSLRARLESVAWGAEPNVQADWAVEASSDDGFIRNRPSIPPAPVQADWRVEESSDPAYIRGKPDLSGLGRPRVRPDWLQQDSSADDFIRNKPSVVGEVADALAGNQADWSEGDPSSPSYIRNRPARVKPDWWASESSDAGILHRPDLSGYALLDSLPQADWSEGDPSSPSYIRNRPARVKPDWWASESSDAGILHRPEIPPPQVQADWNESDASRPSYIRNRPSSALAGRPKPDWWASESSDAGILHRPDLSGYARLDSLPQADWEESSAGSPSYVRHRPTVDQSISAASPSARAASSKAVADYVARAVSGLQPALPEWRTDYWDAKQDPISAGRMARWDAAARSAAEASGLPLVSEEVSSGVLPVWPSSCTAADWPSGAASVAVELAGESSSDSSDSSESGTAFSRTLLVALDCTGAAGPLSVSWPAGTLPASSPAEPGSANVFLLAEWAPGLFAAVRLHPPARSQVQADWDESSSGSPAFVRNRPYVPPVLSGVDLCAPVDMWPEGVPTIGLVAEHLAHRRSLTDLAAYAEEPGSWQRVSDLPEGYSAPGGPYDVGVAEDGVNHLWELDLSYSGGGVTLSAFAPADAVELELLGEVNYVPVSVTYRRSPGGFSPTGDRLALRSEVAQADWDESDSSDPSFVRNRPDLSLKRNVSDLSYPGEYADWTDSKGAPYRWDAALRKWTRDPSWTGAYWAAALWYSGGKWHFGQFDVGEETGVWAESGSEGDLETSPAGTVASSRPVFTRQSVYSAEPGTLALRSDLAQADWDESSSGSPAFVRNRPSGLAPLASPAFTGTPTAPTAAGGTNTTQVATTAFVHGAVSGKADKVVPSPAGNLAALNAQGNLMDSGAKPSDFAAKADLHYRLVEPGKWEFSGLPSGETVVDFYFDTEWLLFLSSDPSHPLTVGGTADDLTVSFLSPSSVIIATRASLPGHLLDRAGNRVVVSGDTTLTLPASNPGYLRDFLVRLEISGSTVPTITFAAPTGETLTYETDGDEFPVPDEAGTWSYSFTENCVSHKFAVSLKKVNEVAQGGNS